MQVLPTLCWLRAMAGSAKPVEIFEFVYCLCNALVQGHAGCVNCLTWNDKGRLVRISCFIIWCDTMCWYANAWSNVGCQYSLAKDYTGIAHETKTVNLQKEILFLKQKTNDCYKIRKQSLCLWKAVCNIVWEGFLERWILGLERYQKRHPISNTQ